MDTDLYDVREDGSVELRLHVQPAAGRSAIRGRHGDAVKVSVGAPPEKGRANDAVVQLLARTFGVAAKDVSIVAGETSRTKRARLAKVDLEVFRETLEREVGTGRGF